MTSFLGTENFLEIQKMFYQETDHPTSSPGPFLLSYWDEDDFSSPSQYDKRPRGRGWVNKNPTYLVYVHTMVNRLALPKIKQRNPKAQHHSTALYVLSLLSTVRNIHLKGSLLHFVDLCKCCTK